MHPRPSSPPIAALLLLLAGGVGGSAQATPTPSESPSEGEDPSPSAIPQSPTPGDTPTPPPAAMPFAPGELTLTEAMIAPDGNANAEWVEFHSLAAGRRTLTGCVILSAELSGESSTCALLGVPGNCSTLTPLGAPEVSPGEIGVLERLSYLTEDCGLTTYARYEFSVSLSNSKAEAIRIFCDGGSGLQEVASLTYDWASSGGARGQSLQVDPDTAGLTCPSVATEAYCIHSGAPNYGSPGVTNDACPVDATPTPTGPTPPPTPSPTVPSASAPAAGELLFTELMVAPVGDSKAEWIELKSSADSPRWLGGCYLLKESSSLTAPCETLGVVGRCAPIQAVDSLLVDASSFALLERDSVLSTGCGITPNGRYSGGTIALGNSGTETLSLHCPAQGGGFTRVTETAFNFGTSGASSGQSLSRDPSPEPPATEGDFCPAPLSEAPFCTLNDADNYGSPGTENPDCPEVTPTPAPDTPTPTATPPDAPRPSPGDFVFSELMIAPVGGSTAEYVEVLNTQSDARWLGGCYLHKISDGVTSTCDDLGIVGRCEPLEGARGLVVEGGEVALFLRGTTLSSACDLAPAATYGSDIALSNSDTEILSLYCPGSEGGFAAIASVTYDWDNIEAESGQSVGLDQSADPATATYPEDYCPADTDLDPFCDLGDAPNFGSPGEVNPACPEPPPVPGPGDVVFTELMIAPLDSAREWIELAVVSAPDTGAWSLAGCQLIEGDCEDLTEGQQCSPEALCGGDNCGGSWSAPYTFGSSFTLDNAAPTVLGKSGTCLASPDGAPVEDGPCALEAAGSYGTVSLTNSAPGQVYLLCPDTEGALRVVDRVSYDWARDEGACPLEGNSGCSYSLRPEALETASPSATNDEADAWCVSGGATTYESEKGGAASGTPGSTNICADAGCPAPSSLDMVFTEVMVGPVPSSYSNAEGVKVHEWFEWVNLGGEADLSCCRVEVIGVDARISGGSSPSTFSLQGLAPVPAGEREVWAEGGCLLSERGDDDEIACLDSERLGISGVRPYSGLSFSNSTPQYLSLICVAPGGSETLVDEIVYDQAILPNAEGRSYQLSEDAEDAVLNDDAANWCGAPLTEESIYVQTEAGPNFGSPGTANVCGDLGDELPGVAGCTCRLDTAQAEGTGLRSALSALALMLLGLGLRRRRS